MSDFLKLFLHYTCGLPHIYIVGVPVDTLAHFIVSLLLFYTLLSLYGFKMALTTLSILILGKEILDLIAYASFIIWVDCLKDIIYGYLGVILSYITYKRFQ